ncbi:hypothetical protein HID58_057540 [Brassica napus]|uniref:CRM domain-containing protein n=1 Tax=Brassica napus TaxID=3708 RepID=A0ABQ8ARE0_BRANA|nr:hypothetical protein HID58_057540 [Brassica napus]
MDPFGFPNLRFYIDLALHLLSSPKRIPSSRLYYTKTYHEFILHQITGEGIRGERRYLEKDKGQSSIERIVLRLWNLGLAASDDDEEDDAEDNDEEDVKKPVTGEERLGDLLKREWEKNEEEQVAERNEGDGGLSAVKKRRARAPSLAELTIEDSELWRLRRDGMYLRVRINIPKAGLTQAVMEKIHDTWRKEELVRLKFHERRTGGMVIWRAGSVMVVYRGRDYQGPSAVFNQMARPEETLSRTFSGKCAGLMREDEATLGKITKPRRPRTVVLCPTRELSKQVLLLLLLLFSLFTKISCCSRTL